MTDLQDTTNEDPEILSLPQKRYFRQRAHVNPIADHNFKYPLRPSDTEWFKCYNNKDGNSRIRYLDVGCGFGGLLISLSAELKPGELALGMEIRTKVSEYVQKRILALRSQHPTEYDNV